MKAWTPTLTINSGPTALKLRFRIVQMEITSLNSRNKHVSDQKSVRSDVTLRCRYVPSNLLMMVEILPAVYSIGSRKELPRPLAILQALQKA